MVFQPITASRGGFPYGFCVVGAFFAQFRDGLPDWLRSGGNSALNPAPPGVCQLAARLFAEIPDICHHLPPSGGLDEHVLVARMAAPSTGAAGRAGLEGGRRGARSRTVATTAPTWANGATESPTQRPRALRPAWTLLSGAAFDTIPGWRLRCEGKREKPDK